MEERLKHGIVRAMYRAIMEGVWAEDFKARIKRQIEWEGAEHDSSKVLKVMHELSKEQVVR